MNLPPEIITFILGYLDLKNLLKCRLVSKYFNSLITRMKISPLAICQELNVSKIGNYFYSRTPISSSYFISRVNLKMFENKFFMMLLSEKVRKVYVDCSVVRVACINEEFFLNTFKQTEQLQIVSLNQSIDEGYFVLELKNLEILSISSINLYKLKLNCPKLKAFCTSDSLSKYTFEHPETVKDLEIFKFDRCMQEFVNLERACIGLGNTVDPDIFKIFFNLKELKFDRRMDERRLGELVRQSRVSKTKPVLYYLGEKINEMPFN